MTDVGGASPGPALTPVAPSGRGPSRWVALGLLTTGLAALVAISFVAQSGDRPGPQAAGSGPSATPTATPVATPSPAAPPTPPPGTPPLRVAVAVGPAPTCPPGTNPHEPGPADQARPPSRWSSMAFDRESGRVVLVGQPDDGGVETWTFDVCTNTWTRMHPNQGPPPGQLTYDVDSDVTIAVDWDGRVWAYDLEADTWTEKGSATVAGEEVALRFYHPASGLVVGSGDDGDPGTRGIGLWSYEVETDTWTPVHQANRLPLEPLDLAYDASVDRVVAFTTAGWWPRTWLFDLRTGIWSGTGADRPEFSYGVIAYDEAAERTVMVGNGRSVAYDAVADRWETLYEAPSEDEPGACGSRPECRMGRQLVYDAVNERLVAYGGMVYTTCGWEATDDMWAFDMATRSWALIVPPTAGPPPLRDLATGGAGSSTGLDRSAWIRPAKATLHRGPFFRRVAGVADQPWTSTPPAAPATVVDGLFLPECQLWTDSTVWWEETGDPSARAWIEIDLGGTFVLDAAVIQADMDDEYRLSYWDPKTALWVPLWDVPLGDAGGMATRPYQGDPWVRWPIAPPVVTDALRFEATSGDAQYSVSEIAVFGWPTP